MATISRYETSRLGKDNPQFSALRSTIETAFYGNNVEEVKTISEAYERAAAYKGTIVLDQEVAHAEDLGLPKGAKVLVDNGGRVTGRTAAARHLSGTGEDDKKLLGIVRDALYANREREYLTTTAYVGLDEDFMVRARLMVPSEEINNLYSWLLNFHWASDQMTAMYERSKVYEDESDILIYSDPKWKHPDHPNGFVYFDPKCNVVIVLGLPYFGELKKGTLTLAWAIAGRHGYVSCHGGMKEMITGDKPYVAAFFGLSGTGKSTLTHAKHEDKYEIKVLHDDAFVISLDDFSSIALEPSYFDKTQDYPYGHPEQKYFVTAQNVGVSLNEAGEKVLVTEDIRNNNGRTVKSRYSTPNRVDKFDVPINSVFWLMKDETLPPVVKIEGPELAMIFGLTLTTKRSTAENLVPGTNMEKLVIEPFANPFRVYPLQEDCDSFEQLFNSGEVHGYILNTGFFMDKKITPAVTLGIIESLVEERAEFVPFGPLEELSYMPIEGYEPDFANEAYRKLLHERLNDRAQWIKEISVEKEPLKASYYDTLNAIVEKLAK